MAEPLRVLVVVPGTHATRAGIFLDRTIVQQTEVPHPAAETTPARGIAAQLPMRRRAVADFLAQHRVDPKGLRAVAAPGGLLRPVPGGAYRIDPRLLEDAAAAAARWGFEHPCDLSAPLVDEFARQGGCPGFVVDPISTDEMDGVAALSGVPDIRRRSLCEAATLKAAARIGAGKLRKDLSAVNLVAVHLGYAVSVAAIAGGRIVDVSSSYQGTGSYSAIAAGTLSWRDLLDLVTSGPRTAAELKEVLSIAGGLSAYLGSPDARAASEKVRTGEAAARLALEGLCYQVGKECGAMAAALKGKVDGVVVCGGMARSAHVLSWIHERVRFLGPMLAVPGEIDLAQLAESVVRVLRGEDRAREYPPPD